MKQTKKLGRGLEDFSHLFLSSPEAGVKTASGKSQEKPAAKKSSTKHPQMVCVAGERGAEEKAFLTASLAAAFAAQGNKAVVFDADFGLPRLCMLMEGIAPHSLLQLIAHPEQVKTTLREDDGITLITLDADIATLAALSPVERLPLMDGFRKRMEEAGVVLVMISGTCINQAQIFIESADDIVVVVPQPVAEMINAYGLIKRILQIDGQARVGMVASRSTLFHQADAVFEKMQRAVRKFLNKPLLNHGYLPDDPSIARFLKRERSASEAVSSSETARCLEAIAQSLAAGKVKPEAYPAGERRVSLADKLFA